MNSELRAAAERLTANSWDVYGQVPKIENSLWFALADKITSDGEKSK